MDFGIPPLLAHPGFRVVHGSSCYGSQLTASDLPSSFATLPSLRTRGGPGDSDGSLATVGATPTVGVVIVNQVWELSHFSWSVSMAQAEDGGDSYAFPKEFAKATVFQLPPLSFVFTATGARSLHEHQGSASPNGRLTHGDQPPQSIEDCGVFQ